MNHSNKIYEKLSKPYYQAACSLVIVLLITIFVKLLSMAGLMNILPEFYWKTSGALLFFYIIVTTVFSLVTKNTEKYWRNAIYSYLLTGLLGGGIACLASSISIHEAGSYYGIYMVLTICFLVFLSIASLMKTIVDYAENEKWEKPRKNK